MLFEEFEKQTGINPYSYAYYIANGDYMSDNSIVNNSQFCERLKKSPKRLIDLLNRTIAAYKADLSAKDKQINDLERRLKALEAENVRLKEDSRQNAHYASEYVRIRERISCIINN